MKALPRVKCQAGEGIRELRRGANERERRLGNGSKVSEDKAILRGTEIHSLASLSLAFPYDCGDGEVRLVIIVNCDMLCGLTTPAN